jgi:hypothetical protein
MWESSAYDDISVNVPCSEGMINTMSEVGQEAAGRKKMGRFGFGETHCEVLRCSEERDEAVLE